MGTYSPLEYIYYLTTKMIVKFIEKIDKILDGVSVDYFRLRENQDDVSWKQIFKLIRKYYKIVNNKK